MYTLFVLGCTKSTKGVQICLNELIEKVLNTVKISLYLEYYKGSTIDANGKRQHLRTQEYLKIYLHQNPKTPKAKNDNKENLKLAENILAIRKTDYIQGRFEMKSTTKSKRTFLNFFSEMVDDREVNYSADNYGNWKSTFAHLKKVVPKNLTFDEIDEKFVKKVKDYFDKQAATKSNLPLSQNSKHSYFNKFKASLKKAFDDGFLSINYSTKVKSFEQAESQREYLTFDELKSLAKAECKYPVLKKAFLFSCLSGLRWSDINTLIWSEVRDEGELSKVNFRQEKTDGVEYLYISKQARELLGDRQAPQEKVFRGLKYGMTYNHPQTQPN